MRKSLRVLLVVLFIILGINLHGLAQSDSPDPFSIHTVVLVTGQATFNRSDWNNDVWEPIAVGMEVKTIDLINPDIGEVVVMCADLTIDIIDFQRSPNCQDEVGEIIFPIPIRGGSAQFNNVPYLISPRYEIISDQPTFRWAIVNNAVSYSFQLLSGGSVLWESEDLTLTQLPYPLSSPLSPGVYIVNIKAYNASGGLVSTPESEPPNFVVLKSDDRARVIEMLDRMQLPTQVDDNLRIYARAVHYGKHSLFSEAIDLITPLLNSDSSGIANSPFVYLSLGEWYYGLDLLNEARSAYETAIRLADEQGYRLCSAQAYVGLSDIFEDRSIKACHLKTARNYYESLGDLQMIELLDERLADLGDVETACP